MPQQNVQPFSTRLRSDKPERSIKPDQSIQTGQIQTGWSCSIGRLRIVIRDDQEQSPRCIGLYFSEHVPAPKHWCSAAVEADWQPHAFLSRLVEQLQAYFTDGQFCFDIPFEFIGTAFQQRVWQQLTLIPAGETRTYSEIAEQIGRPTAARSVATAIANNPLSIIVPCHRVVARSGALAGFAGGIERKRFLLEHEAVGLAARRHW